MNWKVYMVKTRRDLLYTGITTNLERRLRQHNGELRGGAKALRNQGPVELVWSCSAPDRSQASKIEACIKKLTKAQKWDLVRHPT